MTVPVARRRDSLADSPVVRIERLDLNFEPRAWPFAEARRAEIDAHFAKLRRERPTLWNGRVLLLHRHAVAKAVLQGSYLETDFASFIAWRDWGFPDPTVANCFALGALRSADGAFILGIMADHTANAGRVYFPGGTPDPSDVVDGRVDLDSSVRRELLEETGLGVDDVSSDPAWQAVLDGPRIALLKVLRGREPATRLRERIRRHLATQATPELADIHIVRSAADLRPSMPNFVQAFLADFWASENASMPDPARRI